MLDPGNIEQLRGIRRHLHAHPEVSEKEFGTQEQILQYLKEETSAEARTVAKTGVMALFDSQEPGATVMIRGDIDALPIVETNDFGHKSTIAGVSHKCGHDGHTTILLGLAKLLSGQPIQKGRVILLFQPAEEVGVGANAVLEDAIFNKEQIDQVYALHNLPGYEQHAIVIKEQEFTGNVKSIILKMTGKTAHAAEPEQGVNPGLAIAELLSYADHITHNQPASPDFFLMTPIHATLGDKAYGISAGYGELHFTIRSWSTDLMAQRSKEIVARMEETCYAHQLSANISWTQVFHANINDPAAVEVVKKAAEQNGLNLIEREYPFRWGEDFGLFTQKYKGAMFGLGAGTNIPALHNPDYDFPDEITPTGILMFHQIISQIQ